MHATTMTSKPKMDDLDGQDSGLVVASAMHPTELQHVKAGLLAKDVGIGELRAAIPAYCFKPSYFISFYYLAKDILMASGLLYLAVTYIPLLSNPILRTAAYLLYGFVQGLIFTGLWVLAHECGHSAFSLSKTVNNIVGWTLHSFLLTPYFSWKSSHARHHIYCANMDKDMVYVPLRRNEYAEKMGVTGHGLDELVADAPIVTFLRIVLQQTIGWLWYLITNITAGRESLGIKKSKGWFNNSHLDPTGSLFRKDEFAAIFASDVGLGITMTALWYAGTQVGFTNIFFLYGVPYMWVNHWIVAITYLHHTHPTIPKYEDASWTFLKGALATIDRDFGFIGRNLFHGIIEYHVIHHLFSRIPFYYGPIATAAIVPLLGDKYHRLPPATSPFSFVAGLWQSFTECQWVEPSAAHDAKMGEDKALWYHTGPSPRPEVKMRLD